MCSFIKSTRSVRKKTIRIILASTLLVPVWIFIGGMIIIFPWPIFLMLCPFRIAGYALKLWVSELTNNQRKEYNEEIKECLYMMIAPLIASYYTAMKFIEKGEFEI